MKTYFLKSFLYIFTYLINISYVNYANDLDSESYINVKPSSIRSISNDYQRAIEGIVPQTREIFRHRSFDGCNYEGITCVEYIYQTPGGILKRHHIQGFSRSQGYLNYFVNIYN